MANSYKFLGVRVDNVTMSQVMQRISRAITSHQPLNIATVNPELIMIAQRQPEFKQILNNADIVTPDGVGILLTGKLTGRHLNQRVTGADICLNVAKLAAENNYNLYLLGAAPGIAQQAAASFKKAYPALNVTADSSDPDDKYTTKIINHVTAAKADILLVAYGSPTQEVWIANHRAKTKAMVTIGVGGSFDFIAGAVRRAPKWVQSIGLEWLWRLVLQPSRFKRMLVLPVFALKAIFERRP